MRDPLLRDWSRDATSQMSPAIRDALVATQGLVNRDGWAKSCIRHTKDFLLGLGAGNVEGGFNGFLAMRYGGAEAGYRGGDGFAPPAQRRRTDSGVATENLPPVKSPLAEDAPPSTSSTPAARRAPLPHYPPPAASAAWRVASPSSEGEGERAASYYHRRPLAVGGASSEGAGFGGVAVAARMPLPSVAARVGSVEENRGGGAAGSPGAAGDKRPKRRELSKEQREHAAAVRRLGACGECKARKVKCSPSHHRGGGRGSGSGSPGPTSPRTTGEGGSSSPGGGGGGVGPIVRKRKSE